MKTFNSEGINYSDLIILDIPVSKQIYPWSRRIPTPMHQSLCLTLWDNR